MPEIKNTAVAYCYYTIRRLASSSRRRGAARIKNVYVIHNLIKWDMCMSEKGNVTVIGFCCCCDKAVHRVTVKAMTVSKIEFMPPICKGTAYRTVAPVIVTSYKEKSFFRKEISYIIKLVFTIAKMYEHISVFIIIDYIV